MKSAAETMWKQYKFEEGWVWPFFGKVFHGFLFILTGIYFLFIVIFVNTVLRIATKSHTISDNSARFDMRFIYVRWRSRHKLRAEINRIKRNKNSKKDKSVPVCALQIRHTNKNLSWILNARMMANACTNVSVRHLLFFYMRCKTSFTKRDGEK